MVRRVTVMMTMVRMMMMRMMNKKTNQLLSLFRSKKTIRPLVNKTWT